MARVNIFALLKKFTKTRFDCTFENVWEVLESSRNKKEDSFLDNFLIKILKSKPKKILNKGHALYKSTMCIIEVALGTMLC